MPVIIDGTLGVNAAAVTTTNWNPTNLVTPGNSTLGDAASDSVTINAGTTTFAATGARITGEMSTATWANRLAFQSSVTNGNTTVTALPNGTSLVANFQAYAASDPTNGSVALFGTNGTEVFAHSDRRGTGTYLPMTFYTGGTERLRVDTSGNVGIALQAPGFPLHISSSSSLAAGQPSLVVQGSNNTERIQIRASKSTGGQAVFGAFGSRGTSSSPTVPLNGDALGYYQLGGYNGTDWTRGSWISGYADGDWSSSNCGASITFSTTPNNSTTMTERMRIDSAGNVFTGGVTGSVGQADANSTAGQQVVLGTKRELRWNNTNAAIYGGAGGSDDMLYFYSGNSHVFRTASAERMRINISGQVTIGGTSTNYTPTFLLGMYKAASDVGLLVNADNGYLPYINFSTYSNKSSYGVNYNTATPAWQWCYGQDGLGTGVQMSLDSNNTLNVVGTIQAGNGDISMYKDTNYAYLQSWSNKPLYINSQGNNVIFQSLNYANVGIGLTSPAAKLDVNGRIKTTNAVQTEYNCIAHATVFAGGKAGYISVPTGSTWTRLDVGSANSGLPGFTNWGSNNSYASVDGNYVRLIIGVQGNSGYVTGQIQLMHEYYNISISSSTAANVSMRTTNLDGASDRGFQMLVTQPFQFKGDTEYLYIRHNLSGSILIYSIAIEMLRI